MSAINYAEFDEPCLSAKEMAELCARDIRDTEGYEAYPYFCREGAFTIGCGTMLCHKGKENGTGRFEMAGFTETQKQYAMDVSKIVTKGLLNCVKLEDGECSVRVFKDTNGCRHIIKNDEQGMGQHFCLNNDGRLVPYDGSNYQVDGSSFTMDVERIEGAGVRVKAIKNDEIDGVRTTVLMPNLTSGQANTLYRDTFESYYTHMRNLVGRDVFDKYPLSVQSLLIRQSYNMGTGTVEDLWADNNLRTLDGAIAACEEAVSCGGRTDADKAMVAKVKQCYHSSSANGVSPRRNRDCQLVCEEITPSVVDRIVDEYLPEVVITASKPENVNIQGMPDELMGHRNSNLNKENFWNVDEIEALSRASTKEYFRKERLKYIMRADAKAEQEQEIRLLPMTPELRRLRKYYGDTKSIFNKRVDERTEADKEVVNDGTERAKNNNVSYMLSLRGGR